MDNIIAFAGLFSIAALSWCVYRALFFVPGGVVPINKDAWEHLAAKAEEGSLDIEKIVLNPESYWRKQWALEATARHKAELNEIGLKAALLFLLEKDGEIYFTRLGSGVDVTAAVEYAIDCSTEKIK